MGVARFVFLSGPAVARITDSPSGGVMWALVATNNRTLGRSGGLSDDYPSCRDAAVVLQKEIDRIETRITNDETGQFFGQIYVDGESTARSNRSFLRARECSYNLDRFRAAVPAAAITSGVRVLRNGRVEQSR